MKKFRVWCGASKKFLQNNKFENFYLTFDGKVAVGISDLNGGQVIGEVCEPTIQICTGLFDKNNVEIFEGDIIETKSKDGETYYGYICAAVFLSKENSAFMIADSKFGNDFLSILTRRELVEIIGNIFENPELLTKSS